MADRRFEHALTVKVTEMRDDMDRALRRLDGTIIRTRSEFLRSTLQYCLDVLTESNGGSPVSLEERIRRVLSA